jgi:hypothetical protein
MHPLSTLLCLYTPGVFLINYTNYSKKIIHFFLNLSIFYLPCGMLVYILCSGIYLNSFLTSCFVFILSTLHTVFDFCPIYFLHLFLTLLLSLFYWRFTYTASYSDLCPLENGSLKNKTWFPFPKS